MATGHYARLARTDDQRQTTDNSRESLVVGRWSLLRPHCAAKNDQTYFLWQLTQRQLRHVLFPIGEFPSKEAVREEAKRRGIPSADRRSTRGICFVGKDIGYAGFLEQFLDVEPGDVVTTSGRVVGQHRGAVFATLGQRQGIGVSDAHGPYYVVEKDLARNRLVVAPPAEAQQLYRNEVVVGGANWISGGAPALPIRCASFMRHPQERPVACTVSAIEEGRLRVRFDEPQYAPTPGQSVVFFLHDAVLGGGVMMA